MKNKFYGLLFGLSLVLVSSADGAAAPGKARISYMQDIEEHERILAEQRRLQQRVLAEQHRLQPLAAELKKAIDNLNSRMPSNEKQKPSELRTARPSGWPQTTTVVGFALAAAAKVQGKTEQELIQKYDGCANVQDKEVMIAGLRGQEEVELAMLMNMFSGLDPAEIDELLQRHGFPLEQPPHNSTIASNVSSDILQSSSNAHTAVIGTTSIKAPAAAISVPVVNVATVAASASQ